MEISLNDATELFDKKLAELSTSKCYLNYLQAKNILDECEEANNLLKKIKELQKIKRNLKDDDLKDDVNEELDKLHEEYDCLFEVAQFNHFYDIFYQTISEIKFDIENIINT